MDSYYANHQLTQSISEIKEAISDIHKLIVAISESISESLVKLKRQLVKFTN